MRGVVFLPNAEKKSARRAASKSHQTKTSHSRVKRTAHELKDCMATLILALTSAGDRSSEHLTDARTKALVDVVDEMARLVDEIVQEVEIHSEPIPARRT